MSCTALCPICGKANACHLEKDAKTGSQNAIEECWCYHLLPLPKAISVPSGRCICSACWNKLQKMPKSVV